MLSTTDKILLGIEIIRKYDRNADLIAQDGVIRLYFSEFGVSDRMMPEDKQKLRFLDWFEEFGVWSHCDSTG